MTFRKTKKHTQLGALRQVRQNEVISNRLDMRQRLQHHVDVVVHLDVVQANESYAISPTGRSIDKPPTRKVLFVLQVVGHLVSLVE